MRRLILFRHGKAEMAGPSGGDRDRPLAARGVTDSTVSAGWLAGHGFTPDLVLVSSAARTRSTWEAARSSFPEAKALVIKTLYLASPEAILAAARAAPAGAEAVMVIGHNPGLQELGVALAVRGGAPQAQVQRIEDAFPTAGVCVFGVTDPEIPVLEALYEPPRHAGEAPRWAYRAHGAGDPP